MSRAFAHIEASSRARQHPHWALVERVASSQCFRTSTRLREFLLYVCDCALRDAPEEATEQQIGVFVFQRQPGYNSSEDSIVRTHARGLRQRLLEYFSEEGAEEQLLIEIPKGHYLPVFVVRHLHASGHAVPLSEAAPVHSPPPEPLLPKAPAPATLTPRGQAAEGKGLRASGRTYRPWVYGAAAVLLLACLGAWRYSVALNQSSPVERLWAPFLADDHTLVIYSNALFVGNSTTGLRYAPAASAAEAGDQLVDTYTGVGELASVYALTQLFDRHHESFTLKRNLLVTWDEAKLTNLVFIGSIAENSSLRALPTTMDFALMATPDASGIVNMHPHPGEQRLYARPEHPLTKDYAILALLPGLQQGRRILIFSGLTTLGTQAAVEFACHRETAAQLLRAATGPRGEVRPFEAVLETSIAGDVPLATRLVTIHVR